MTPELGESKPRLSQNLNLGYQQICRRLCWDDINNGKLDGFVQQTLEGNPSTTVLRLGEGIERQEIEKVYRFRKLVNQQIEEVIEASGF